KLWRLELTGARIATGLQHLADTQVSQLGLNDTQVDDAALLALGRIQSVQALSLDGTRVTSTGLAHLAGLKQLSFVSVNRTDVDDAGIRGLAGLALLDR